MRKYSRPKKIKPAVVIIVTVLLLVVLFFSPLSRFLKTVATPLWQVRQEVGSFTERTITSKRALQDELAAVGTELVESRLKLIQLAVIEEENKSLKALLGRSDAAQTIITGVLTSPNQSLYNTFQIDAGATQGVVVGARVFVGDSTLVGTVTDVAVRSATVTSLASPGEKTSAFVAGSNIAVTVTGRGGGDFEVELPRDIPFETGMAIVSQGVHSHTIATIERIISDPRDPFQKLLARMPVNLRNVKWVLVEKK